MDRSFGAGAKDLLRLALSLILRKRPERMLFAPDAIESNGSYYLYFCLSDGSEGVARSDRPEGPFRDAVRLPATGIDPAVFVDDDGAAYYYWGQIHAHGARLNGDMMSLDLPSQSSPCSLKKSTSSTKAPR
jgi:beta-xylosidase